MDPRHPSQLYEAGLEGLLMMAILAYFFWRTDARYKPGFLFGLAAIIYGLSRFAVEFVREPDVQLGTLSWGLTMGQTLTIQHGRASCGGRVCQYVNITVVGVDLKKKH